MMVTSWIGTQNQTQASREGKRFLLSVTTSDIGLSLQSEGDTEENYSLQAGDGKLLLPWYDHANDMQNQRLIPTVVEASR